MGRYASYKEVITRYPTIESWGKDQTEIEGDLITNTESELDGYLGLAFSVPFSAAHQTVKDLTIDLAYLRMLRTRDVERYTAVNTPIMGRIDALVNGKALIVTGSGTIKAGNVNTKVWSSTEDFFPTFSMLDVENSYSHVDSSMLADDEAERA